MSIGIDYRLFWHLNPTKLKPFAEADELKQKNKLKEQELISYMHNIYTLRAIGACLSKKSKYPEKPLNILASDKKQDKELTEDEIKRQREALILNLQIMQANYELSKNEEREPS